MAAAAPAAAPGRRRAERKEEGDRK